MIPYISWWRNIIAWLIWRYEDFEDMDEARFSVMEHPELLRIVSLLRDYWYVRHGKEWRDA